jgi:hypothetical protein
VFQYLFLNIFYFNIFNIFKLIFEISNLIFSDWVSFLTYPNLFGIKDFVVVAVVVVVVVVFKVL